MFSRLKTAVNNVVGNGDTEHRDIDVVSGASNGSPNHEKFNKFPYSRPDFLHLSPDEVQVSADHTIRPILVPRDISKLPWNAGYAE